MTKKEYQLEFAMSVMELLPQLPPIQPGKNDITHTEKINGWYYSFQRTVWDDGIYDILVHRQTWKNDDRPRTKREFKREGIWVQPKDNAPQHHFTLWIGDWGFTHVMKHC